MKGKVIYKPGGQVEYLIDGVPVTKEVYDQTFPSRLEYGPGAASPHIATFQPLESRALAVHPVQVAEVNAQAKKHGTGVVYDKRGRAHVPTREARRREMKVRGFRDNDAGYSD